MFKAWEKRKANKRYAMFENWLNGVLAQNTMPNEVVAVNFNIYDGANATYDVELIGAPGFDENDDDWACEELFTSSLFQLPTGQETEGWEDGFLDIIEMVQEYLENGQFKRALKDHAAVGVGHVNGAIEVVYKKNANEAQMQQTANKSPQAKQQQNVPQQQMPTSITPPQQNQQAQDAQAQKWQAEENQSLQESAFFSLLDEKLPAQMPQQCFKLIRQQKAGQIVCKPKQDYGVRPHQLLRGVGFAGFANGFTFVYRQSQGHIAADYLNNSFGWLLLSAKAKKLLQEMESQVEYFDVLVQEESTGNTILGYCVANILRKEDALCLEESDYDVVNHPAYGSYNQVKKYAIRASAVNGADIFKLPNHQEVPIFVSQHFKACMEENGISGMGFCPVKMC